MKPKPILGQTLYSLNIGNAARHKAQKLTPVKVTKVGRKYFTCTTVGTTYPLESEYHLEDWREHNEYSACSELYESEEEWNLEVESSNICIRIADAFPYGRNKKGLSIETLRKILALVEA